MTRSFMLLVALTGALVLGVSRDAPAQYYPLPTLPPAPPPPELPPSSAQPLTLMSPFPIVRIVGRLTPLGARVRLLAVRAPASATIRVRCFRRGCRRRQRLQGRGFNRAVRFRRLERDLRAGTIIEVRVERAAVIGKLTRFRVRRGRSPARRDLCLRPNATRGTVCPEQ